MHSSSCRSSAWYPILAVGISMVDFISIKTGRDAVFFGQGGLQHLPLVYILVAIVSVPGAMIHLEAMKRWGARKVRANVLFLTAVIFLCFAPWVDLEHRTAMLVMFVLVPAAFAAVFAATWLLAGDLLEGADETVVHWVYSRIGVGSMLGGITGGLFAKSLSVILAPRFLVVAGAIMLLVATGIVSRAHRKHPVSSSVPTSTRSSFSQLEREVKLSEGISGQIPTTFRLMKEPYLQGLIGISMLGAVAALYIDFQFYAIATLSGHVDAQFFGSFYTILNLSALGLQLVAAPCIQSRYGIGGALLVLPMALLGGAGMVTMSTALLSRSILKVTEGGFKSSIHRSTWEQVFLRIGHGTRDMAKVIVDGIFARMSEGIAAALYLWLLQTPTLEAGLNLSWLSWVIVAVLLLWIILTRYVGQCGYSQIDDIDPIVRIPDS